MVEDSNWVVSPRDTTRPRFTPVCLLKYVQTRIMSLKSAAKAVCDSIGVNEFLVRRRRSDLLVLCYHGVLAERRPDRWSYENWVGADEFRAQLRWLKRCLRPVGLADLSGWQAGDFSSGKPPVLITFDDGYRNNLTVAAPILKEENVPAVFFLATGYIGTSRTLWNDEVRLRVLHWPEDTLRMPSDASVSLSSSVGERRTLAGRVTEECKQLDEDRCASYLEYLRSKTSSVEVMNDPEAQAFMSWNEARELADMGFELGAHTVEHPILSRIGRSRMLDELSRSKADMERELNRPCTAIAYPNGTAQDVSDEVFEAVRAIGYRWAFMTTPVWQKPGGDVLRISRVGFPGHSDLATFKFYVSGLRTSLSGAARIRAYLRRCLRPVYR